MGRISSVERQAATAEGGVAQLNGGQVRAAAACTVAARTPDPLLRECGTEFWSQRRA